jgi:hypothetical protein
MQSNNPILTRVETVSDYSQPMTVKVRFKNLYVDHDCSCSGYGFIFLCAFTANVGIAYALQLWVQLVAWF